jgi:hypothetical protein
MPEKQFSSAQFERRDQDVLTNNREAVSLRIYATCPKDRKIILDSMQKIVDYAYSLDEEEFKVFIVEVQPTGAPCTLCVKELNNE